MLGIVALLSNTMCTACTHSMLLSIYPDAFPVLHDEVRHRSCLPLAEGPRPHVDLRAGSVAGPLAAPPVAPVPVRVRPGAAGVGVLGAGLSPHAVLAPGVLVPVRVHHRHDVDVVVVEYVPVGIVVLHKHVRQVEHRGRTDPLPGVDAAVNPDCWAVGGTRIGRPVVPTDLDDPEWAPLVRIADGNQLRGRGREQRSLHRSAIPYGVVVYGVSSVCVAMSLTSTLSGCSLARQSIRWFITFRRWYCLQLKPDLSGQKPEK